MAVNIPGVIAIVVFFLLAGSWNWHLGLSSPKGNRSNGMEMSLLGNRGGSLHYDG